MRYLRAILNWFILLSLTAVFFIFLMGTYGLCWLVAPKHASFFVHRTACIWGRMIFAFIPGWSYSIEGGTNLPRNREAVVFVANHQSAADIPALLALGRQFRWLSKDSVFRVPVIGHAMRWAGYIAVKRGNAASHKKALADSAGWLRRGVSMVYFPEGSRSLTGNLKPFKPGAFRLSEAEGVAVVPIAITGTRDLVKKRSVILQKGHVKLYVLPRTTRLPHETLEQFMERVRGQIQRLIPT